MDEKVKKKINTEIAGIKPPRSFILSADVLRNQEDNELIKDDIKQNRIVFEFPDGMNDIDIFDRCRFLFNTENFEICYETLLAMLEGKPVKVYIKNYDNKSRTLLTEFQVTSKEADLRSYPALNKWPILVNWLIEFMVVHEEKKYPLPLNPFLENQNQNLDDLKAAKSKKVKKKKAQQNHIKRCWLKISFLIICY